ncbi:hypothetical protein ACLHDG_00660 [Sulfurovum sp. CS9]|uniref:hypothetical protein n=1 Tax=Sulfurovum sp. CS9 TaxID=3391146 RepID=UPI0039E94BD6
MKNLTRIALSVVAIAVINGCDDSSVAPQPSNVTIHNGDVVTNNGDTTTSTSGTTATTGTTTTGASENDVVIPDVKDLPRVALSGNISSDMKLTADTLWILDGLVVVQSGATLTIDAGTVIAGLDGTGDATSYMIIDKGAKIVAEGTSLKPITFTSTKVVLDGETPAVGLWGGLTLIGHAGNDQVQPYEVNSAFAADATNMVDSSGVLRYVNILNSGITMEQDKEINGLSFVGVGSGTVVEDIRVDLSGDDGVEIWGGTVNLTNITITRCTDDYFDIDDGYSGTVKNLSVSTTTGNAGIEMSGNTYATFDGFEITTGETQSKEGAIYFKKDGIGGHFKNGTIIHNGGQNEPNGAIHSKGVFDAANTSFENVTLVAPTELQFIGDSSADLESAFFAGTNNKAFESITDLVVELSGNISSDMTLTSDKLWVLDGLVVVESGATLTIEAGTVIAGCDGTGDATSYMIIDKGAKIFANGTSSRPIIFTSTKTAIDGEAPSVGQWGGLTIIGHAGNDQVQPYEVNSAFAADATDMADSSGVFRHVKILNSGITMEQDKEINGLSFVGVGSGTIVEDITVDRSDDDGVEIWGGTVNLTNVFITRCTDDYFDIDDGYSGTVKNLRITTTTGNAGIEMSGNTYATFDGFEITTGETQSKEGGIYFKKDGIGGHFKNGTVTHNGGKIEPHGAIHSKGAFDAANTSFENVTLNGASALEFTGDSAADLETEFDAGSGNTK